MALLLSAFPPVTIVRKDDAHPERVCVQIYCEVSYQTPEMRSHFPEIAALLLSGLTPPWDFSDIIIL